MAPLSRYNENKFSFVYKKLVVYSYGELCGYFMVFDIFYGKNRQKVVYYPYMRKLMNEM